MNPSAPIFPTQNYFRWKYLRTTFVSVSLSFKYLVRVENMQLNYHLCCLDFSGSLFWFGDELTTSIKTKLQIFGKGKKECKYFQILKVHFHNEWGLRPKRYFQVFFKPPQNLFTCQISKWSDTPFKFFANRYPIFGKFVTKIFFLQYLNSCLPIRTGILRFWSKMSKI